MKNQATVQKSEEIVTKLREKLSMMNITRDKRTD